MTLRTARIITHSPSPRPSCMETRTSFPPHLLCEGTNGHPKISPSTRMADGRLASMQFPSILQPQGALPHFPTVEAGGGTFTASTRRALPLRVANASNTPALYADDKPDTLGYPEVLTFATTLNLAQSSKPGKQTVFRYGCRPRGSRGCAKPRNQQQEQHQPKQCV